MVQTLENIDKSKVYVDRIEGLDEVIRWGNISGTLSNQTDLNTELSNKANNSIIATGSITSRNISDRFADIINVKDFGAVGDGITNDTAAIQAAFNKCGNIYIPDGEYKCADALYIYSNSNIQLSPKAKILFTGTYGNHTGLKARGSVDSLWHYLTTDIGRGTKEIPLDNVTGFSVGDTILIADDRAAGIKLVDGETVSYRGNSGEMHVIKSIDTANNTITIEDTIFVDDFTIARNAFVKKLNTLENIYISGGEISGIDIDESGGHFQNIGIDIYCVNNFKIENMIIQKFRSTGIKPSYSNNGIIEGCSFSYIFNEDLGYSIMNAGSQNITTRSCNASLCGKLWDTGYGAFTENDVTYEYGWTRFVTCKDSKATACTRAGVGTHEATDYVLIDNNTISLDNTIEYSGINIRSNNANVTNNSIIYCGHSRTNALLNGISIFTRGKNGNIFVTGNKIIDVTYNNINVYICEDWETTTIPTTSISTYKPTRVIIDGNYIESSSTKANAMQNMIYVCGCREDGEGSVSITNNNIRMTNNRKAGIFISGKLDDVSISNNIIYSKRPIYILGDNNAPTTIIKNLNISNNTITVLNGSAIEIVPTESPNYTATVNSGSIFGNLVYTIYNSLGTFTTNVPEEFLWYNSYVYPNGTKGMIGKFAVDSNLVHKTGDESITGVKTFQAGYRGFRIKQDSSNNYSDISFYDNSDNYIGTIRSGYDSNDEKKYFLLSGFEKAESVIPNVTTSTTSKQIATCGWVNSNVVHLSGAETIVGNKTFTDDIIKNGEFGTSGLRMIQSSDLNNKGRNEIASYYNSNKIYFRLMNTNITSSKAIYLDIKADDSGNGEISVGGDVTIAHLSPSNTNDLSLITQAWINSKFQVVSAIPASPDSNIYYFIPE